jgi:hypothetical protein
VSLLDSRYDSVIFRSHTTNVKTRIARPDRRRLAAGDGDSRAEESVAIPKRDDDRFRAMGYVAVYAAYVEEAVEKCFRLLPTRDPLRPWRRWRAAAQIESCLRAIALPKREKLLQLVDTAAQRAKRP